MKLLIRDLRRAYNVLSLQPGFEAVRLIRDVLSPMGDVLFPRGEALRQGEIDQLRLYPYLDYVDVLQTSSLLSALYVTNPKLFRPPTDTMSVEEVGEMLFVLDSVNQHSAKKRTMSSCVDILDGQGNVLVEYGEVLLLEKWRTNGERLVKAFSPRGKRQAKMGIRRSESQIAVYANFYLPEKERKKTFLINVNILYNLINEEGYLGDMKAFEHLDRFQDVLVVDRPSSLLSTYKSNPIKLLIVEDSNNPAYRSQLIELKQYDPYARLMCVGRNIKPNDKPFCNEVAARYAQDLWE